MLKKVILLIFGWIFEKLEHGVIILQSGKESEPPAVAWFRGTQPGEMDKDLELPNDYCGSCYGAAVEGKCCNTCKEVTDAYSVRGWTLHDIRRSAEQVRLIFCVYALPPFHFVEMTYVYKHL